MAVVDHDLTSMMKDRMAEDISPTVARRRIRLALREARENAGLTQLEVAEQMEWSSSKVIRIENGEVTIAPNDLRYLLSYLGIKDKMAVADLLATAKIARTRQRRAWYQDPKLRPHLTDAMRKLIEYEAEATWIHSYSVFYVPGVLQLPEYSTALMDAWSDELDPDQVKYRLDARRRRHDAALARAGELRITALLDESVFRRLVRGPAILRAQLNELLRFIDSGLLTVRVLRFDVDVAMSYNADFDILFLGDDGDLSTAVMYRETGTSDEILEGKGSLSGSSSPSVERHYDRYQKLWNAADSESDTIDFIRERIRELG